MPGEDSMSSSTPDVPFISKGPVVPGGDDAWVDGTRVPVSEVLHLLSVHGSIERVAMSRTAERAGEGHLSVEAIQACITYGLRKIETISPLGPVAAGFLERWRRRGVDLSIDRARGQALEVLARFSDGATSDTSELPEHLRDAAPVAFSYAASIVRNGRFPEFGEDDQTIRGRLSSEDKRLIEDYFAYRSEIALHRITPERLLHRWAQLVADIERGYKDGYDEFANDLDGRDILEEGASLVSPAGRSVFREQLDPLDERYEVATRASAQPLRPPPIWEPVRWWWYRTPTSMSLFNTPNHR